ncbi:MAG: 3-phosphoshikimate 1-carboxyvinyltransferase [Actinomycetota bacterium]|nr:3-phosphoshikimate 1-carboxyvinyltransferase [Actinomycetota bacterium]
MVLPGSKSMTNRALVLAAIADRPTTVERPLRARDTVLMADALRALGVEVADRGNSWQVTPAALRGPAWVDCGLAGTVLRFVPPLAALGDGPVRFDGDERARERPMRPLLEALSRLGVQVDDNGRRRLPFTVAGSGRVAGGPVALDASSSSQFVSALLLAGARYDRGVEVTTVGAPVPSRPHLDMTVHMLRERGVAVTTPGPERWVVRPGPVAGVDVAIEPDLSNAGPFLAAAVVTAGRVTVPGWPRVTDQAGDRWRDLLNRIGAAVTWRDDGLVVQGSGRVHGLDVDLHDVGELAPVLAAVCAVADSPSYLRGVAHLRGHETDRLAAIATELTRLGAQVTERQDGMEIRPRPLRAGVFRTYGDHRMAHAAAVLGLVVPGVVVEDVAATAKTHPDFTGAWEALLG